MRVQLHIKLCGIRQPDDARAALDAGADLIGVNFVRGTPRCVDLATAEAIDKALEGAPVERVAVFMDASRKEIDRVLKRIDFDRVQLHGRETPREVALLDRPVIKSLRGADAELARAYSGNVLLVDHPRGGGGHGSDWDWSAASELVASGHDVLIAGGLTPENVAGALEAFGDRLPFGVDVSSGIEGAEHRKDPARMRAFVAAVRECESRVRGRR